ncbi:hypothetical protein RHSP_43647 [Rhizobium freirei PRF 81]|uniref:Uncharacterized protein n=1 Tax=Rhizobium freirei PRF 81 TaxID=363754 RepID=N6U866_9HYPH|nr:hypothetical protein RHSP_43647 [Rhizobium freirei PRF 81]
MKRAFIRKLRRRADDASPDQIIVTTQYPAPPALGRAGRSAVLLGLRQRVPIRRLDGPLAIDKLHDFGRLHRRVSPGVAEDIGAAGERILHFLACLQRRGHGFPRHFAVDARDRVDHHLGGEIATLREGGLCKASFVHGLGPVGVGSGVFGIGLPFRADVDGLLAISQCLGNALGVTGCEEQPVDTRDLLRIRSLHPLHHTRLDLIGEHGIAAGVARLDDVRREIALRRQGHVDEADLVAAQLLPGCNRVAVGFLSTTEDQEEGANLLRSEVLCRIVKHDRGQREGADIDGRNARRIEAERVDADALNREHIVAVVGAGIDGAVEQACTTCKSHDALVVDQVACRLGRHLRVALVVGQRIGHLAAVDAAGIVQLLEDGLGGLRRIGKIDDAGDGRDGADLDRPALAGRPCGKGGRTGKC